MLANEDECFDLFSERNNKELSNDYIDVLSSFDHGNHLPAFANPDSQNLFLRTILGVDKNDELPIISFDEAASPKALYFTGAGNLGGRDESLLALDSEGKAGLAADSDFGRSWSLGSERWKEVQGGEERAREENGKTDCTSKGMEEPGEEWEEKGHGKDEKGLRKDEKTDLPRESLRIKDGRERMKRRIKELSFDFLKTVKRGRKKKDSEKNKFTRWGKHKDRLAFEEIQRLLEQRNIDLNQFLFHDEKSVLD